MNTSSDTLIAVLCWTCAAAGFVGLLLALFWDRARGRRRCPKCWYDMAGLSSMRCPECGNIAPDEKRLKRTRRRWRWAVLAALILCSALGVRGREIVRTRGWMGLVPTSVIVFLPYHEDSLIDAADDPVFLKGKGRITSSLRYRLQYEELWGWQNDVVAWRIQRRLEKQDRYSPDGGSDALLEKLDRAPVAVSGPRTTAGEVVKLVEAAAQISVELDGSKLGPLPALLESPVGVGAWRTALDALDDTFGRVAMLAPWVQAQWYEVDGRVVVAERGRSGGKTAQRWKRYDMSDVVDSVAARMDAPAPRVKLRAPSFGTATRFAIAPPSPRVVAREQLASEFLELARGHPRQAEWLGDWLFVEGDPGALCRARFAVNRLRAQEKEGDGSVK